MSDPTNPNDNWQQVPNTPGDPAAPQVPPAAASYPPPDQGYPPPPQGAYPPPPNYPPPTQGAYAPPNYPPPTGQPQAAGLTPSAAAAIAYLTFIPAIIFLVMEPYKRIPLVRYHAIQSIALNVVAIAVGIVIGIISVPMVMAGMWTMVSLMHNLINLAFFIAWLIAIIQAAQGKWFKLPLIGDMSLKMAQK